LEAIVAAMLVDQGLLSYTDKVAKYWPEFAQNGKEDIKVCDVLRHESGLAWFKKSVPTPDCFLPEKIKENALGSIIETEEQHFAGLSGKAQVDTRRDYHAFTRGLLMNEIIRRADSKVYNFISTPNSRYTFQTLLGTNNRRNSEGRYCD
jgi:CubicO group peptidase (beta-lactamase class C family)